MSSLTCMTYFLLRNPKGDFFLEEYLGHSCNIIKGNEEWSCQGPKWQRLMEDVKKFKNSFTLIIWNRMARIFLNPVLYSIQNDLEWHKTKEWQNFHFLMSSLFITSPLKQQGQSTYIFLWWAYLCCIYILSISLLLILYSFNWYCRIQMWAQTNQQET